MPTEQQIKDEYEAYLNNTILPIPDKMADRVEQRINNSANKHKNEYQKYLAEPEGVDYDIGQTFENLWPSTKQVASDTWQAITNPIDTLTGVGKIAAGTVQKYHPDAFNKEYVPQAEAAGEFLMDRYGGTDELKTTAMEDPAGLGLDAAGLFTGGLGFIPKVGKLGKIAAMLDPLDIPPKVAGATLKPEKLYQSSAKMHSRFDEPRMTEAALREGILPTDAGIAKAQQIVGDVGQQITAKIDEATASGQMVEIDTILSGIDKVKKDLTYMDVDAKSNLAGVVGVVENFKEMLQAEGKTTLSPGDAQLLKQKAYRKINWNRENMASTPASEATLKSIALEAKASLEDMIPSIKELNLRQADMIELQEALGVPASRIGRRDIIGIGTPIKAMTGSGLGGLPGAVAGTTLGVFDSPHVKARVALAVNKLKALQVSDARKRVIAIEILRNEAAIERESQNQ